MPLPSKSSLRIFDPRRGEDYKFEAGSGMTVSTLRNELLVVYFYPGRISEKVPTPASLSLSDFNRLIKVSIQKLGRIGFFTISPLTKEVEQSQELDVKHLEEMLGSVIGYFDINVPTIEKHFDLRCRLATYAEWNIGSCARPFEKPNKPKWWQPVVYWDITFLFTQIENIGCLSSFYGETGELFFFTRIYTGIDELLEPLYRISETLESDFGHSQTSSGGLLSKISRMLHTLHMLFCCLI